MKPKIIDAHFTAFWGVFLNLDCNLNCPYCIQKISLPTKTPPLKGSGGSISPSLRLVEPRPVDKQIAKYEMRTGKEWVQALNAIPSRTQNRFLRRRRIKKLSILGGEPTIYPDFLYVINQLDKNWKLTVTSNFDSSFFEQDAKVIAGQVKNKSRIRFNGSLHFMRTPIEKFITNVKRLKKARINVHTLFIVAYPGLLEQALDCKRRLSEIHPRVKLQRFLGFYQNQLYPQPAGCAVAEEQKDGISNYALYREAFGQEKTAAIFCHSDKVLFSPNGDIYNCHYKVYTEHKDKLGNIFSADVNVHIPREYFFCSDFGFCNPCDSEGHLFKRKSGKIESISEL